MEENLDNKKIESGFLKKTEAMKKELEKKLKSIQDFQDAYIGFSDALSEQMKKYSNDGFLLPLISAIKCMDVDSAEEVYRMFNPDMAEKIRTMVNNQNSSVDVGFVEKYLRWNNEDLLDDLGYKILPGLRKFKLDEREDVLSKIQDENPMIYNLIKASYFESEDILRLSDRDMQKVLREVDFDMIVKALTGASENVRDKFYRNCSRNIANALKEKIEYMKDFSRNESDEYMNKIISVICRLEDCGEIVIASGENDFVD